LEKRATVIDSIRNLYKNVLLLDAGDLFDRRPKRWRHENIIRAYQVMRYDAVALGDRDFVEGPKFLISNFFTLGNLVNTNIQYMELTFGQPYIIKQFDGVKIGITAAIDSSLANWLWVKSKGKFTFLNPVKALKPVIEELQAKSDFIILLAHGDLSKNKKFAEQFPQIGLIVSGHTQQMIDSVLKVENAYLVQTDGNAFRLGKATLNFKEKKLDSFKNELILLDDSIPNSPAIMEIIEEYKKGPKLKSTPDKVIPKSKIEQ